MVEKKKESGGTISVRTQIDLSPLEDISRGLDNLSAIIEASMDEAKTTSGENTLQELQRPAPRRKKGVKVRWKTEKQRRYVLGFVLKKDSKGNIIPYKRTGKMRKAWEITQRKSGDKYSIGFRNRVAYTRFVQGTLNLKSLKAATAPQQPFHKDTGWKLAQPIAKKGIISLEEAFQKAFDRRLALEFGIIEKTSRRSRTY